MLHQGGSAFDPVAIVAIQDAIHIAYLGMVNVPTHGPVITTPSRFIGHGHFKIADEVDGFFDFELEVSRQRPVLQSDACAQSVQVPVDLERQLIQPISHISQPLGALDHTIKMVPVHHPQLEPGGRGVHGFVHDLHPAKSMAGKMPCKFVVVTRHINHPATFTRPAQQFLHHIVVALWPKPAPAQLPSIYDVAHQIQDIARVVP